MAKEINLLMGEVTEKPEQEERDVEFLLINFLRALVNEQQLHYPPSKPKEEKT